MDAKTPTTTTTTTNQHQRAPRTPESYFNVPESIALLNIVKSERIQSAFQSNRKNHASVWEMVAEILNRFSARKRSSKQCCNRYENLKKIYTQLKKNPEKHVRRNWPYMYLFKEIEDQRGETWGANGKRLQMGAKEELSYYHRRRAAALNMLIAKDAAQQNGGEDRTNGKVERYMANSFVEAQLNDYEGGEREDSFRGDYMRNGHMDQNLPNMQDKKESPLQSTPVKHEPISDSDFNPDDITLVHCDYNGSHNFYPHNIDPSLLHPDVIVDTDNISESSSRSTKSKRKTSTSTDGDSTNYELIEYLKRRERRDEEMFKRMEEREKRLLNLLERTVIAIECLAGTRNRFE